MLENANFSTKNFKILITLKNTFLINYFIQYQWIQLLL